MVKNFQKGKQTNRNINIFSWNKSSRYYVHVVKSKEKTVLTTNNRFLLMLGTFKSDQLFAEKKKLENTLHVDNLNHLLWNKSPANYIQQIISKITKKNNCLNFNYSLMLGEFWNDQ